MRAAADEPDVKRKLLEVGQVDNNGKLPEWPNGADCKSAGVRLRWFESITSHSKNRLELQKPGCRTLRGSRTGSRLRYGLFLRK